MNRNFKIFLWVVLILFTAFLLFGCATQKPKSDWVYVIIENSSDKTEYDVNFYFNKEDARKNINWMSDIVFRFLPSNLQYQKLRTIKTSTYDWTDKK